MLNIVDKNRRISGFVKATAMWFSRFANTFLLVLILRLFDSYHRKELVGSDVVEGKRETELEGSTKIKRPAQELSRLGILCGVQPVEGAFFTAASIVEGVGAEPNVAQIFPPQRPINQEPQGGLVRPLCS